MAPDFDLTRYSAGVFDLDGTVWLSESPIPGAVDFVERCRAAGLTITFATNATAVSATRLMDSLLACGLGRDGDAVVTSGSVVSRTLAELGIAEIIAEGPPAMIEAITAEGIVVNVLAADAQIPDGWTTPAPGRAVLLSASRWATFGSVERIGHLAAIGYPLYVPSLEPGFPALGRMEPGAGMLVAAARVLYDIDPIVLGKPSRYYADVIRKSLRTDGPVVVFGDSQRADIGIAEHLGADGVLITSRALNPDLPQPHYVTTGLAEPIARHAPVDEP